jgi:hypothetical protein
MCCVFITSEYLSMAAPKNRNGQVIFTFEKSSRPGCALSGREFFDFFLHVRQKLNPISGSKQESRSGPAAEGRRSVA